jgi:hypothetical protein
MTPSSQNVAVLVPLVVSFAVIMLTIVIHGGALVGIVNFVRYEHDIGRAGVRFWSDLSIVSGATLLALIAHLLEVTLWALVFCLCNEFTHFAEAFYSSAMNYTSLGSGDIIMSASWKMLGPLETADGMLMFGVSTAMIFAVIQRLVQTRFHDLDD